MSRDRSIKGISMRKDQKSKESNEITNRPLSHPGWRNTYERMRRSHKGNYNTMKLVANAHICMHIEEYCRQHKCTNIYYE